MTCMVEGKLVFANGKRRWNARACDYSIICWQAWIIDSAVQKCKKKSWEDKECISVPVWNACKQGMMMLVVWWDGGRGLMRGECGWHDPCMLPQVCEPISACCLSSQLGQTLVQALLQSQHLRTGQTVPGDAQITNVPHGRGSRHTRQETQPTCQQPLHQQPGACWCHLTPLSPPPPLSCLSPQCVCSLLSGLGACGYCLLDWLQRKPPSSWTMSSNQRHLLLIPLIFFQLWQRKMCKISENRMFLFRRNSFCVIVNVNITFPPWMPWLKTASIKCSSQIQSN